MENDKKISIYIVEDYLLSRVTLHLILHIKLHMFNVDFRPEMNKILL